MAKRAQSDGSPHFSLAASKLAAVSGAPGVAPLERTRHTCAVDPASILPRSLRARWLAKRGLSAVQSISSSVTANWKCEMGFPPLTRFSS